MSLLVRLVRAHSCVVPTVLTILIVLAAPRLADAELVWAIADTTKKLVAFASEDPGTLLLEKFVSGLDGDEELRAIDFRPLDGQLYGYGSKHRIYRINPLTGKATPISPAPLAITVDPIDGIGFDFNPVTDEIRIIAGSGQNFRVNPTTGEVIDGNPGVGGIQGDSVLIPGGDYMGAAYTNNYHGAADTTLVGLNRANNTFVRIGGLGGTPSPNLGAVTEIGPTNQLLLYDRGGLDVSRDNQVFANFGGGNFFVIDRTTGDATLVGQIGAFSNIEDIAVLTVSPTMYLLTNENRLLRVKRNAPSVTLTDVLITGLASPTDGEKILAIDVRPATGRLYGLSNFARLYTINPLTGAATRVGDPTSTVTGLTGFSFGMDFDPVLDQLRIVSDTQSNIRVVPDTMTVFPQTALDETDIGAIAYRNHFPTTTSTDLFAINSTSNDLVMIGGVNGTPSPDAGQVFTVRDVDEDVPDRVGLDHASIDNTLYMAGRFDGDDGLYSINSGVARLIGPILNAGSQVIGLAVASTGVVQLSTPTATVNEDAGTITVTISRVGPSEGPFSVNYALGTGLTNPATHNIDYTNMAGTLIFLDGETSKTVVIPIIDDTLDESDETFLVLLFDPTLDARIGTTATTVITIVDNDAPGNAPPTITITQPTPAATFTAQGSLLTLGGTAADAEGIATISWSNDRGGSGTAQGTTTWLAPDIPLVQGANVITVTVTDTGGLQSTDTLTVTLSTLSYILAEGATGPFFDLDILLANPNTTPAPVTVTFLKEGGSTVVQTLTLPELSRTTLRVDTIAGLESAAVSTVVTSDSGLPLIVERTMQWDASGYGAHTEKAAETPARKWYFAEGSQGFFYTYLLLVNPGTVGMDVIVQYLREGTSPVTRVYTVPAQSRFTVDAGADAELVNRSFGMTVEFQGLGVAERAMYFGLNPLWKAGHESAGATTPATEWLLAEGATGSYFDTFLLLSNPGTTPANATLTYLLDTGTTVVKNHTVPAEGRLTINVEFEDPALANAAFGTTVSSSQPVVVERAQYWPTTPDQWQEAHNSFGVLSPGLKWGLAEGRAGGPNNYQTYILLANPAGTTADVTITFLRTTGAPVVKTFAVPAFSRFNVAVGAGGQVPELANSEFGAVISSTQPVVVERAMYGDGGGATWSAGTNATATRLP